MTTRRAIPTYSLILHLFAIIKQAVTKSSNQTTTTSSTTGQFIVELVRDVLRWRWLVVIAGDREDPVLSILRQMVQQGLGITLITAQNSSPPPAECYMESAVCLLEQVLYNNGEVNALLMYETNRTSSLYEMVVTDNLFRDSDKIRWLVLFSDPSDSWAAPDRLPVATRMAFVIKLSEERYEIQTPREKYGVRRKTENMTVNSWTAGRGFDNLNEFFGVLQEPKRMNGEKLKVAMERHFPFFVPRQGNLIKQDGSDITMLDDLGKAINFTYEVHRPPDGRWGQLNNSVWTGMMGMLVRKEVDAAMAGMTVSRDRYLATDFTIPYAFDRTTFVTRYPAQRSKTMVVFWPFNYDVWIVLAVLVVSLAVVLYYLHNCCRKLYAYYNIRSLKKLSLNDAIMCMFGAVVSQGFYKTTELCCRILIGGWWLFTLTVISGYKGCLMSFMANPGSEQSIDTVNELVSAIKRGVYTAGIIKDSAEYGMFKESDTESLQTIQASMVSSEANYMQHDAEGLKEVLQRPFAYIGGEMTVKADVWNSNMFLFSKESFLYYGYGIAFRKGFPYLKLFNRKIQQLVQSGLLDKWIKDLTEANQTYDELQEQEDHVLSIYDIQGAFVLLATGLFLSTITFLLEIASKSHRKATVEIPRVRGTETVMSSRTVAPSILLEEEPRGEDVTEICEIA